MGHGIGKRRGRSQVVAFDNLTFCGARHKGDVPAATDGVS